MRFVRYVMVFAYIKSGRMLREMLICGGVTYRSGASKKRGYAVATKYEAMSADGLHTVKKVVGL
jgi:hypothetical protein